MSIDTQQILREFPEIAEDTADIINSCCDWQKALNNVLGILRTLPDGHIARAAEIVAEQISQNDPETIAQLRSIEQQEDQHLGSWDPYNGFPKIRTRALKAAIATIGEKTIDEVRRALSEMEPFLRQLEQMRLEPAIDDWDGCLELQRSWQHHVLKRDYDHNTMHLLGERKELHRWNSAIDARKVDDLIIVPILSQEELATEAALNQPDIYPRYINRCIANTARIFVVMDDESGATVCLCMLRMRKGAWRLSEPTRMSQHESVIRTLEKFAKTYQALSKRAPKRERRNRPAGIAPQPKPQLIHTCRRCNPGVELPKTTYDNTPARCPECRQQYQDKAADVPVTAGNKVRCASCNSRPAPYIAQVGQRDCRICSACELIAREFAIYHRTDRTPLKIPKCRGCAQPMTRWTYNGSCADCENLERTQRADHQAIVTYLHRVMEARADNLPEPEVPPAAQRIGRADLTDARPDAPKGRLSPALSVEICREYIKEERFIPELSLRFNTSIPAIKDVLRGKTWRLHTEGHRPTSLRDEPSPERTTPIQEKPKPAYITVSRLKSEYGWTDSLIAKHLGEHDREAPNPHYRSAAPMRLYLVDRVQETTSGKPELREDLQKTLDKRQRKQETREQDIIRRRDELLKQVAKLQPRMRTLPTREYQDLMQMAAIERQDFLLQNAEYHDYDSAPSEHITVNMIRHEYTNYELLLENLPRSRNVDTNTILYQDVKRRTLEMIAREIPQLQRACETQAARLYSLNTMAHAVLTT